MTPEQRDEMHAMAAHNANDWQDRDKCGQSYRIRMIDAARRSRLDKPEPSATHEEIAEEASKTCWRRSAKYEDNTPQKVALEALRLQSEGWTPTPPVDPDVLAARKILASLYLPGTDQDAILRGLWDDTEPMQEGLQFYRAGREAGEAKKP